MNHSRTEIADALRRTIDSALYRLREWDAEASREALAPGKWTRREMLGHLIDSASNNHQRFVRARGIDSLVFPGYDQDEWVSAQHYAAAPWDELLSLWHTYNHHLARVIESTPLEDFECPRHGHNLHQIAWRRVPPEEPTTLGYFMNDYVGHLRHHLTQIGIECD